MAGVRAMLSRVQRLERAGSPVSPFERHWGSLEAWEAFSAERVAAGALDRADMAIVVVAVRRWHRDGLFAP